MLRDVGILPLIFCSLHFKQTKMHTHVIYPTYRSCGKNLSFQEKYVLLLLLFGLSSFMFASQKKKKCKQTKYFEFLFQHKVFTFFIVQ